MDNYRQHIGKEVSFDHTAYANSLYGFNKHLQPAIIALAAVYKALSIGEFTQPVFKQLMEDKGIKKAEDVYTDTLNLGIASLKLPTSALETQLLASVPDIIFELGTRINAVNQAFESARAVSVDAYLEWSYVSIVNGKPVLDEDAIRKAASRYIETDTQAKLHYHLLQVQEHYHKLQDFLKANCDYSPPKGGRSVISNEADGLFLIEEGGKIQIKPDATFTIDTLNGRKRYQQRMADQQEQRDKQQREHLKRLKDDPYYTDSNPLDKSLLNLRLVN